MAGKEEMHQQFQDLNQKNKLRGMAEYVILIADSLCWSAMLSYTNVVTLAWFRNKEAGKSSLSGAHCLQTCTTLTNGLITGNSCRWT